jgi:hypothetical protein
MRTKSSSATPDTQRNDDDTVRTEALRLASEVRSTPGPPEYVLVLDDTPLPHWQFALA